MNGRMLITALELINTQRQEDYGSPRKSLERIARLWSVWLNKTITAHDVACMMVLFKMGREAGHHKKDNLLDAAGYLGIASDLAEDHPGPPD